MNLKIYFNDKPLFLTDNIDSEIEPFVHHDDAVFIDEFSSPGIKSMIHEMREEKVHAGIFYHEKIDELKKAFWKKFTIVIAAGGLVLNEEEEILLMFRRGKWDLPKGKLDKGETTEDCALRETTEETGLMDLKLEKPITTTYHTYDESGKHILKETYWFLIRARKEEELVPQANEQITRLEWVKPLALKEYSRNMYASIKEVLKEADYL